MTRADVAMRLLQDEPMTFGALLEITGWTRNVCRHALEYLLERGIARRTTQRGCNRVIYQLSETPTPGVTLPRSEPTPPRGNDGGEPA